MSTIEEALVSYLENAVPGAGNGYPAEVPQDASLPSWAYQVVDSDAVLAHDGPTGIVDARIQIDLLTDETAGISAYGAVKALAKEMRTALDGYKGLMGGLVQVYYCKTTLSDDWADIHKLPEQRFDVTIKYKES